MRYKNNLELLTNIEIKPREKKYLRRYKNKELSYLYIYKFSKEFSKYFIVNNSLLIPSLMSLKDKKRNVEESLCKYTNLITIYESKDYELMKEDIDNKLGKIEDNLVTSLSICHQFTLDNIISEQFVGFGSEEKKKQEFVTRKKLVDLYSKVKGYDEFKDNRDKLLSLVEENEDLLTLIALQMEFKEKILFFLQDKVTSLQNELDEINFLIDLFKDFKIKLKVSSENIFLRLNKNVVVVFH